MRTKDTEHTKIQKLASWVEILLGVILAAGAGFVAHTMHANTIWSVVIAVLWFLFACWCQATGIEGGIPGLANVYNDWPPLRDAKRPAPWKSMYIMIGCMAVLSGTFCLFDGPAVATAIAIEVVAMTLFLLPVASVLMERFD